MTAPYSGPPFLALRRELGALVTRGLTPENVAKRGGQLINLQVVVSRVNDAEDATEEEWEAAAANAFIAVLADLTTNPRGKPGVIHVFRSEHRKVLRFVLPLVGELRGKPLAHRRERAAKELDLKASTVRTYYEPPALDDLVRGLIELEAMHRGETPPPSPT